MSESPKCATQVHRTARKSHKCCECDSEIKKGERYVFTNSFFGYTLEVGFTELEDFLSESIDFVNDQADYKALSQR